MTDKVAQSDNNYGSNNFCQTDKNVRIEVTKIPAINQSVE